MPFKRQIFYSDEGDQIVLLVETRDGDGAVLARIATLYPLAGKPVVCVADEAAKRRAANHLANGGAKRPRP